MNAFDKIYKVVEKIPKGKILTYKEVSILANVNNPKIVGKSDDGCVFCIHTEYRCDQGKRECHKRHHGQKLHRLIIFGSEQ